MVTCYAALADRLLVVRGADGAWTARERLPGTSIESVAASPSAPERVFVGTVDGGLQRSTDGGDTWATTLRAGDRVTAVTVAPSDPDVVWAGTEPSAIYRSSDGGESWSERPGLTEVPSASSWSFPPRPDTHHVRWIAVHPSDADRLSLGIEAGALVRSTDGGETWLDRPAGSRRDNHTLATHPDAPKRVYAAAGDGYAESHDGGETWHHPQDGLDHRYVWGLAVAQDDPDVVFVSAASGPRSAHDPEGTSVVYRREIVPPADRDASGPGGRWQPAMAGLPGPDGWARPVLAAGPRRVYALTNHGLFARVADDRWELRPIQWPGAYTESVPSGLAVG